MENQNANNICKYIKHYYTNVNLTTVQIILKWFRHALVNFIKDEYRLIKPGNRNGNSNISMGDSMFTPLNGQKIRIVGAKIIRRGRLDMIYLKIKQLKF